MFKNRRFVNAFMDLTDEFYTYIFLVLLFSFLVMKGPAALVIGYGLLAVLGVHFLVNMFVSRDRKVTR
ncbi:hypothetical protein [Paenibacillus sp. J22TS3]|uniref:hypothetical protein n=1 Tax=Paenibacillus sp. J22TS3 TaxID=2807192 RepID=UPI001B03B682|nr:hypothetical protein [Paenibacillus sp. J22TS3]GIP21273.1 hypothetical protein J22TS3_15480 [Paenibacillus sp. J22TS3]